MFQLLVRIYFSHCIMLEHQDKLLYPLLIGILENFISVPKQSLSMQTTAMYARYPLRFSSIAWKVIQAMPENLRGHLAYIAKNSILSITGISLSKYICGAF